MTRAQRDLGYFPIDRGLLSHPALKKAGRLDAFLWLTSQAAWKPEGRRGAWGVVHLERGQLPVTVRGLAEKWGWPKSNVARFLDRLKRDGLLLIAKTGTQTGTQTGTPFPHQMQIVTVCHFERIANASSARNSEAGQEPGRKPGRSIDETPTIPGLLPPLNNQHSITQQTSKGGQSVEGGGDRPERRPAPRHGTHSVKHGTVWIERTSPEWRIYAEDYRTVRGAEPMPVQGGYWFYTIGESERPAHQRGWKRVRFGAAG